MSILPPPLPPKGTIGIVAPCRWPKPELVEAGTAALKALGYRVVVHEQVYLKDGRLAGDDAARAEAVRDMFLDNTIDAVMCARGGTGSLRVLDRLDYEAIRANPKPFVGFSDVTALLQAVTRRTGLATYHGPMLRSLIEPFYDPRTEKDFVAMLSPGAGRQRLFFPHLPVAREGRAQGPLYGGCLTLLQALIGTAYDFSAQGAILFIEESVEPLYRVDRMMSHLRLAGKLDGLAAVLVGEMIGLVDDIEPEDTPFGKTLREIMDEHLPPDVPLAFDFPCGHGRYLTTLPIGAEVELILGSGAAEMAILS